MLAGAVQIRRAGTNIQTRKPTIALLTTGLDRFSRNSIYLGMTLGYVGVPAGGRSAGAGCRRWR